MCVDGILLWEITMQEQKSSPVIRNKTKLSAFVSTSVLSTAQVIQMRLAFLFFFGNKSTKTCRRSHVRKTFIFDWAWILLAFCVCDCMTRRHFHD